MTTLKQAFAIFSEKQIEAIKSVVKNNFWGDTDHTFADENTYYAYGYFTNMKKGKDFSGIMSGISKTIKATGTNLVSMCSDWWNDGSGDMMFLNMELLNEKEVKDWANQ